MLSRTFEIFDYCEEWNIFYCTRGFLTNVRTTERFKMRQLEHWSKLFMETIHPSELPLPPQYDGNDDDVIVRESNITKIFQECMRRETEPLNRLNDCIELIKLWKTCPEYNRDDRTIDFYTDLRDFLLSKEPLVTFLWTRLYNDEWNDSVIYDCYYDLLDSKTLDRSMTLDDITHCVIDWFRKKKRRFPSHEHLYWIAYNIDDMYMQ